MTVLRIKKREKNFVILDKTCLQDIEMSWGAKGLHAYLMGMNSDWTIKVKDLVNHAKNGRDAVRGFLSELKEAGYLTVEHVRSEQTGKFHGCEYIVYELPQMVEKEREELTSNPEPDKPEADFQSPGFQTPDCQAHYKSIDVNKYFNNKTTAAEESLKAQPNTKAEKNAAAVFSEKAKRAREDSYKLPTQIPNRLTPEDALIHETLTDNQLKRIERLVEALETEAFMDAPKSLCAEIQYALLSKNQFTACGKDFGKKLNAIRKVILRGDWQRPAGLVLEEDQKMQASVEPIEAELREAMGAAAHFKKMHAVSTNAQSRTQFEKIIKESEAKVNILKQKLQKSLYEQKLRQCG